LPYYFLRKPFYFHDIIFLFFFHFVFSPQFPSMRENMWYLSFGDCLISLIWCYLLLWIFLQTYTFILLYPLIHWQAAKLIPLFCLS
jgi:hypothetical protein